MIRLTHAQREVLYRVAIDPTAEQRTMDKGQWSRCLAALFRKGLIRVGNSGIETTMKGVEQAYGFLKEPIKQVS